MIINDTEHSERLYRIQIINNALLQKQLTGATRRRGAQTADKSDAWCPHLQTMSCPKTVPHMQMQRRHSLEPWIRELRCSAVPRGYFAVPRAF